jgi:glycosyltransferase involved in cell wall biosynthesis
VRIAHVTDGYLPRVGGIEILVHDLAAHQAATGHDVTVVTATGDPAGDDDAGPAPADRPAGVRVLRTRRPRAPLTPAVVARGRAAVLRGGYDVLHVHVSVASPFAMAVAHAAAGAGLPTVVTLHSLWSGAEPAFRLLDLPTSWTRWPVVWTAVSEVAAVPLRRVVAPAGGDVVVLPNAVDVPAWRVPPSPRRADDVLVTSVMRLNHRKRPMPLLRILRQARASVPSQVRLRAVVVGDGPMQQQLRAYLHRHRMAGWVSMPGRLSRDEIRHLYRRADIHVSPAQLESFGIAALEARCAGLAVVAKRGGGVGEFVSDGREGLLCRSDDDLARSLAHLVADPAARDAIMRHNRSTAPVLDWPHALARADAVYLLAGASGARPTERTRPGPALAGHVA